ncbi:MAG: sugar ABC transporter substrate-binding protein [Lachnospiraceae bacterium]|nr:sugar ABC transporter substrate-binding protein [Lachnospiraceae bacterium]
MKTRKIVSVAMAGLMATSAIAACNKTPGAAGAKEFSSFFCTTATVEATDDNEIKQIITEKIGASCKETWLTGQDAGEAIGVLMASGEYPDFINGGDSSKQLYEAGALVAWDDYIEKYPNIKEFYTDYEWDQFRQSDGHIYWMNPFDNIYGEDMTTEHSGEAFWIQVRVLEWAGYPEVTSMDQYFDLLEDYNEANPTTPEGADNIPYTILCEDWRYFCLENAPQFLDGYPNDGSVIVDPDTEKVVDYNTTPTARQYFLKLNEEYHKGIVDPESFTQTYDEYISKLSTGRVLGMVDQWWDFAYTINDIFKSNDTEQYGYNYVPLPITIDGRDNQWYTPGGQLNVSSGIAITTSCQDVEGAFQFIDDLLGQEILDLRNWGVKDTDYCVDENGLYYRTDDQVAKCADTNYKSTHMCPYSYFPNYSGTSRDGINAMTPSQQPSLFMATLPEPVKACFEAYGAETYVDMLHSVNNAGVWFPMWSYSNNMNTSTDGGTAFTRMGECKHEWLPIVVMSDDFDADWEAYQAAYAETKPEDFLAEMQTELDARIQNYNDFLAANS